MTYPSTNSRFIARLLLLVSLCLPLLAAAGTYEDLIRAVDENKLEDVAELLARGADPNTPDAQGNTLLMIAVLKGNTGLVKLLLDAGAKPNLRNRHGDSAIMLASYQGFEGLVRQLYVRGAEINHKGWNPLIYAATNGHAQVVQMLLGVGAEINSASDNGTTALMMAARNNHVETVKVLLKAGANPNIKNDSDGTALGWALDRGYQEVAELLIKSGADE